MPSFHYVILLRMLIAVLSLMSILWAIMGQVAFFSDVPLIDFGIYRHSAKNFLAGELIYKNIEPLGDTFKPGAMVYKMTPIYLLPFIGMDMAGISHDPRWYLLSLTALALLLTAVGFYIISRRITAKPFHVLLPALAIIIWWQPAHWTFFWTSAELWLTVLALWAVILMPRYPLASGLFIAVAAVLKLYPILLLILPLCFGYWRVFKGFVLGVLLLGVATVFIFPWHDIAFYMLKLLPILLTEQVMFFWELPWRFHFGNFQWIIALEKLLWGISIHNIVFKLITIALLVFTIKRMYVARAALLNQHEGLVLALCLVQSLILIYLPNVFFGYFSWLLLPTLYFLLLDKSSNCLKLVLFFLVLLFLLPEYWFQALASQALLRISETQLATMIETTGIWLALLEFEPRLIMAQLLKIVLPWLPWLFWMLCLRRIKRLQQQAQNAPVVINC